MFYYVSGTVAHIEPYLAVIDCGGVGYACRTTSYTLSALKKGDKGKLFTYLNVREDAMELYGFATQEELNLFQQLISVSGVGPKAALSILSSSRPSTGRGRLTAEPGSPSFPKTSSLRPAPLWRCWATPRGRSMWLSRALIWTALLWRRSSSRH